MDVEEFSVLYGPVMHYNTITTEGLQEIHSTNIFCYQSGYGYQYNDDPRFYRESDIANIYSHNRFHICDDYFKNW
jgi:hypothetical protein